MATDLNSVQLIGRLTRDPELRQTGGGTSYCRFGIANNRNYTTNGERREEVSFFNCVAWGRQAEIINQYCRKGKQVAINGRLQQRSWEGQDGKKNSTVDVVVENLQMLGAPGGSGGGGGDDYGAGGGYGGGHSPGYSSEPSQGYGGGNQGGGFNEPAPSYAGDGMDDDDIPF